VMRLLAKRRSAKFFDDGLIGFIPSGSNLSPFTLETSNALLSPLGSHFRWLSCDVSYIDYQLTPIQA
jgi:hypothetical protein